MIKITKQLSEEYKPNALNSVNHMLMWWDLRGVYSVQ